MNLIPLLHFEDRTIQFFFWFQDPDGEDFDDTTTALRIVSEVAEQADKTIKQGVKYFYY